MIRPAPRLALVLVAALVAVTVEVVRPRSAVAHGLLAPADLSIPDWLFTWGAAAVLLVTFVSLSAAWRTPRWQEANWRPLRRARTPPGRAAVTDVVCGTIGVALLLLVVWSGLAGTQQVDANFAPTFVYVVFWLGLVPASLVFGDVFRAFNPWRAVGRAAGWSFERLGATAPEPLAYPRRLGYWPAAVGLGAFAWLELIAITGDEPDSVALATCIYSGITWVGMAVYGTEAWTARGETFSVYFGLLGRVSPLARRDGRWGRRRPLAGLSDWPVEPGAIALLAAMIGTVSFDGLSAGKTFNDAIAGILTFLRDDLALSASDALRLTFSASMLLVVVLVGALYVAGVAGAGRVDRRHAPRDLRATFAHTLVPIALAYVVAHYVSLLLIQGQRVASLASDPLGRGWNLFGTASWGVDPEVLAPETFWYLQVGAVVVGHVAALVLAHDRALAVHGDHRLAVRGQRSLLTVMVAFTVFALWLLAAARDG